MGKTIISQARGHGSRTYRVRRKAYSHKIKYSSVNGEAEIVKFIDSGGHSAPLAKMKIGNEIFYNPAANGTYQGQKMVLGKDVTPGSVLELKDIPTKTQVYNIESRPQDGGKFIRTAGSSALVVRKEPGKVTLMLPSKKEKIFNDRCRASIGIIAGSGMHEKPITKAGRRHYMMKTRNKLWPRTSALKTNAIDHPFGSGRGKNLAHGRLGKIPRRNSPPGANVGSLRARRTGRKKGKITV